MASMDESKEGVIRMTFDSLRPEFAPPEGFYVAASNFFAHYPMMAALLCLMLLDVITGLVCGFLAKELSSSASYKGMCRKAMILSIVATGKVIEIVIPGVPWSHFLATCFIITEAISITENAGKSGVPIPVAWMEALEKLKQRRASDNAPAVVEIHTDHVSTEHVNIDDSGVRRAGGDSAINIVVGSPRKASPPIPPIDPDDVHDR